LKPEKQQEGSVVAFLKMASLKTHVPVTLFFVVASILLTFPVAFEFGRLPGGAGDNLFWAYHVGWLTKSILTHSSPIHDGSVFYPVGFNLIYFSLDSFLAFPFAAIGVQTTHICHGSIRLQDTDSEFLDAGVHSSSNE